MPGDLGQSVCRGDLFVAYPERRPAERLFLSVTRVAKNGDWVDFRAHTWAVMWSKRLSTKAFLTGVVRRDWSQADLDEQERDWEYRRA